METGQERIKDIIPNMFYQYYESKKLGYLRVHYDIPIMFYRYYKSGKFGFVRSDLYLDLNALCTDGMKINSFEQQTAPENVEVICVFGSILYKNFPRKEKIKRKKWFFFGPWIEREFLRPQKDPNDFDALFILKEGLTQHKIILPRHTSFGTKHWRGFERTERRLNPKTSSEEGLYGSYGVIDYAPFGDLPELKRDRSSFLHAKSLHITYRSLEQFLNGIGNGDEISESIIEYGLPLFGKERFYEIIQNIKIPERRALHSIEWSKDKEGKLEGRII